MLLLIPILSDLCPPERRKQGRSHTFTQLDSVLRVSYTPLNMNI